MEGRATPPASKSMDELTRIFSAIEHGDPEAARQLLPLVYRELRDLAALRLRSEPPGHTLEPTALVHEAYLRLVGTDQARAWDGRGHFFAAAAEAMRRILIENARHKKRIKHGGGRKRVELIEGLAPVESAVDDVIAFDEALEQLGEVDREAAELVKLRYFAGLTTEEAAGTLGVSVRSAYRSWAFARVWLYRRLHGDEASPTD
jgi:RNA polymerase sigma factor (TIGR02999 family)